MYRGIVSDLLHPDIRTRASELAQTFKTAQPFRHVVMNEFLRPEAIDALIAEFPSFDPGKAVNELGEVGRKAVVSHIAGIGPTYKALDRLMQDPAFLQLMGEITCIPDLVYDPEYVGGGTHENLDGQDLDVHVDFNYHPAQGLHRRLNLIVFLNPEWHEAWGGCLELHKDPWNPAENYRTTIVPLANRAVLFETTERSWHGFSRIRLPPDHLHLSRKSIAVYFYTQKRPAKETAFSHGTVYVPRPLPEHLQAGHTLTAEDIYTLQVLWERRNAQLRFLYDRELDFAEALARITTSPSFRLGRILTWPARALMGRRTRD
jgi:Rps23 Pro-64 3,4-dihydroxylase Tpa1-like proline 4-hydroxylase